MVLTRERQGYAILTVRGSTYYRRLPRSLQTQALDVIWITYILYGMSMSTQEI
jgi:hypothetical protein